MISLRCLLTALLLALPFVAKSAVPEWQIIPEQSTLTFTGTQNEAPVSGQFKTFGGEIFVDPDNYQASKIHIIVDMNSVSASYADLKETLVTADWFDVKMFPKAEYVASEFKKTGDNQYQAIGTLTIRNKTAPVTLTFTTSQPSRDMGVVEGTTIINRSTFGVGQGDWASTDEIKDPVKVTFKVVAKKK